jgi:sugar-specific transcriptional regulator TrmB
MEELLRKIGLTEGETKVYLALIKLKKSSVGNIIKTSKISASKVYVILDKLGEKGFVSFIIENNIKYFSPTNPKNILEYVENQKKNLEKLQNESEKLVTQLSSELGKYSEESAQIYKGNSGLRVAFKNILSELDKKTEYLFFSVSNEEFIEKTQIFFDKLELEKQEKKIFTKGIMDISLKNFSSKFNKRMNSSFKYYNLTLPTAIVIGKNRILLPIFGENPIAFEIISKRIAQKYRDYFYKLWENIK